MLLGKEGFVSAECHVPMVPEESQLETKSIFLIFRPVPKAQMQDRGKHSSLPLPDARLPSPACSDSGDTH